MPRVLALIIALSVSTLSLSTYPAGSAADGRHASGAVRPALTAAVAVTYSAPVPQPIRVVRPFVAPRTRYGSGHRGVDLASHEGEAVLSAAAGVVTFAGTVAGRGLVVILHPDGVRTEYEPIIPSVHNGQIVRQGQPLGSVHGVHGTCLEGGCLHWGARRGSVYFDPLSLLQPLGVVRLLPG